MPSTLTRVHSSRTQGLPGWEAVSAPHFLLHRALRPHPCFEMFPGKPGTGSTFRGDSFSFAIPENNIDAVGRAEIMEGRHRACVPTVDNC